jgi:hypothetical protein
MAQFGQDFLPTKLVASMKGPVRERVFGSDQEQNCQLRIGKASSV